MTDPNIERLKEIIHIAATLEWIYPIDQPNVRQFSYPLMQLSEVEKCMIAMYDDKELERMRKSAREVDDGTWARTKEEARVIKEIQLRSSNP